MKLFVVYSFFSIDVAIVNSSNLIVVNIFSSNKPVNKLPYSSFGMNLTVDFTTVPSWAIHTYSKTLISTWLICKVIFWDMVLLSK